MRNTDLMVLKNYPNEKYSGRPTSKHNSTIVYHSPDAKPKLKKGEGISFER